MNAPRAALAVFTVFLGISSCGAPPDDSRLDSRTASFPLGPDEQLTPGSLCRQPDQYRYPEHIAYCSRSVSSRTKDDIIKMYDRSRGYQIGRMNRGDFKIDHYLPLCMGGSNETDNLWPQHKSVYQQTDQIEQYLCERMACGLTRQSDAINTLKGVKNDLSKAPALLRELEAGRDDCRH